MRPAAVFISAQPTSHEAVKSLDVFGNDLGEVDVWGDEKIDESPVTSSTKGSSSDYLANALQHAIVITQQGPGNEKSEGQKPPRPAPLRELRAELIQKHGSILNSSPRRIRRASSDQSAGGTKNIIADLPRMPSMSSPHLPPMTPRTRCRKLGIPLVPPVPQLDPTPVVKALSVAEKRRMRNEELLSTKAQSMSFQTSDPSRSLFVAEWNHGTKDNDQAQTQKKALLAEIKGSESKVRHRRTCSDGQGAFQSGRLPLGTREQGDVAAFEGKKDQGHNKLTCSERATSQRSSCREKGKDLPRVKATQRSHSLSRKQEVSRGLSRKIPMDSPKSPRRRTLDLQCSTVELQSNLKNLFGDDPVSSPNSSFKNSAHSGSSKSISSKSDTSKCQDESENGVSDSISNKAREELEKRRSGSLPRRAGRREARRNSLTNTTSSDELPSRSSQSNNTPKAGQKIKFVRNCSFNDAAQVECSQSASKSLSTKSHGGSTGSASKSRRFGRRASLGENISCNQSTSSSRRHTSACPPSPMRSRLESDEAASGVTRSPSARRNSISSRRRSLVKGVAHDMNEISTPTSTGASRRKIRYLKKSEGDQECDLPSISLDSED